MRGVRVTALAAAGLVMALTAAPARGQETSDWSFAGVERIEIDGVSGDVFIEASGGGDVAVQLVEDVRPSDAFRAEVEMQGSTLRIRERWSGRSSSGRVDWTLRVPPSLRPLIVVDTASGDLEASGIDAEFRFETASGDIDLRGMTIGSGSSFDTASGDYRILDTVIGDDVDLDTASGDIDLSEVRAGRGFEISTASGSITIESCEGVLEASTASGNVRVYDSQLDGPSDFSSASGDVVVRLSGRLEHDLDASSASGDVRLEAAFGDDFTLVLSKRQDRGRIDSPFPYTSETTFTRNDRVYEEKTVRRGSGQPEIRLRTASGSISVRES